MSDRQTEHGSNGVDGEFFSRSRRRFLTSAAVVSMLSLAGCSGGDDSDTQSPTATATPAPTATSTPTPTETATPEPTETATPAAFDADRLEQQARQLFERLASGNFEAGYELFAPQGQEALTVSQLEQAWTQITERNGSFVEIISVEYEGSAQDVHQVVAELRFDQQQPTYNVSGNAEGILAFQRVSTTAYEWEQPAYVDRAAFSEASITLEATDSCDLGGTVTLPTGDEQVPGVVLVHGSGPNDRDGTLGPSKPYKELAWGLATNGVAVLRYDKRTLACSPDPTEITIDDVVTDDALTALDRLRNHDRIDPEAVFVAGHSLGGKLVPRIAKRDGNLAGAVMLAAPARSRSEIIVDQVEYLTSINESLSEAEREQQREEIRTAAEKIQSLDIGDDEVVRGAGRPFWRTLSGYDQTGTAETLTLPLLVAQGNRDYQVTVEDELSVWREVLSGNSNVTFAVYDGLNHLFGQSDGQMSPDEYYEPDNPVAETVITDLAEFVDQHS